MSKLKTLAAGLTLSASAFIALVLHEGYTDTAIIPVKNDRPTIGFGSTFHEDGSPVKITDHTTPPKAIRKAYSHIAKEEQIFRDSIPNTPISQIEYDVYMDWIYQYGSFKWMASSMRTHLTSSPPNYVKACASLLLYKYAGGYDCSTPGNRRCPGVWTRQLERYDKCMSANK